MINARYSRILSADVGDALKRHGPLRFLVTDLPSAKRETFALDVQLREGNQLMYYHGTTRVLVVKLARQNGMVVFRPTADPFYTDDATCKAAFSSLKESGINSPASARETLHDCLASALAIARRRYFANAAEGYWQNLLCQRFGRMYQPDDEWLIIDRECVIGFGGDDEKKRFYDPIMSRYQAALGGMSAPGAEMRKWTQRKKGFGDELDMLAIDRDGRLLVIELKHGTNVSGIYWGPVQVGVYCEAFENQLQVLGPAIAELVRQKVDFGLLPALACDRLPPRGFDSVTPVLAVSCPNPRSGCWEKLAEVMRHVGDVTVVTVGAAEDPAPEIHSVRTSHIVIDA